MLVARFFALCQNSLLFFLLFVKNIGWSPFSQLIVPSELLSLCLQSTRLFLRMVSILYFLFDFHSYLHLLAILHCPGNLIIIVKTLLLIVMSNFLRRLFCLWNAFFIRVDNLLVWTRNSLFFNICGLSCLPSIFRLIFAIISLGS